jgi:hypothetical protein
MHRESLSLRRRDHAMRGIIAGLLSSVIVAVSALGAVTDPSPAAFEEAVARMFLEEESPWSPLSKSELVDAGYFYCRVKRQVPYNEQYQYIGNVNQTVLYASDLWTQQHAAPRSTDEILMREIAMAKADRHLCPGWPGHPAPPD